MERQVEVLNVTGPEDLKSKDYRRRVHTQAMRAFRRRERMRHVRHFQHAASFSSESTAFTEASDTARSLEASKDRALLATGDLGSGVQLSFQISASHMDPFDSMALSLSKHQQTLVKHFADEIGPIMDSLNPHLSEVPWAHIWLREAIPCRLLFLATCSHASEHIDADSERTASQLSLQLRGATLSMLKETLEDSKNYSSDAILATLIMLCGNSLISGSTDELEMHNRALNKVISARGELANSGYQGVLRAGAMWGNSSTAILCRLDTLRTPDDQVSRKQANLIDKSACSRFLGALLKRCRGMSAHLSNKDPCKSLSQLDCVEERCYIESGFIRLWKALDKYHRSSLAWVQVARCACLSGLLFAFCHLRGLTAVSAVARKITASILFIMKGMSFNEIARTCSEDDGQMLYWSHAVTVVMSADAEQRMQLLDLLCQFRNGLRSHQMDQIVQRLQKIAWPAEWTPTLYTTILGVQTT